MPLPVSILSESPISLDMMIQVKFPVWTSNQVLNGTEKVRGRREREHQQSLRHHYCSA